VDKESRRASEDTEGGRDSLTPGNSTEDGQESRRTFDDTEGGRDSLTLPSRQRVAAVAARNRRRQIT
jgi:hypothetical protein